MQEFKYVRSCFVFYCFFFLEEGVNEIIKVDDDKSADIIFDYAAESWKQ